MVKRKLPKRIRHCLIGSLITAIIGMLLFIAYISFLMYVFKPTSINDCIKQTKQDLDEIRELVCNADSVEFSLSGQDYDLLGKLPNLESVTIRVIGSASTAQNFFRELTKLKKLSSVTLFNIPGCSIKRLGDIEGLSSLCIEKARYPITDLELLGTYGSFKNLKSLKLYRIQLEALPDLSGLRELESLAIHDLFLTRLEPDCVNWENLVSLDVTRTRISSLDGEIVGRLCNLTTLDLSRGRVTDVSFVLDLPKLKSFSYRGHVSHGVDLERLREHPNFNEDWLKD